MEERGTCFQKLTKAGLNEQLAKHDFLKSHNRFFADLEDGNVIHTLDSKMKAVKDSTVNKSTKNGFSFLGNASYYREFIKNFASITSPFTRLFKNDVPFSLNDVHSQLHSSQKRTHTAISLSIP